MDDQYPSCCQQFFAKYFEGQSPPAWAVEALKRGSDKILADGPRRCGIKMMHILSSVSWISPIAYLLPFGDADVKKHTASVDVSRNIDTTRKGSEERNPNDLFTHLILGDKDVVSGCARIRINQGVGRKHHVEERYVVAEESVPANVVFAAFDEART
ncbi:hypothetical protein AYL99_11863 [Fonsecaea erecta]|uniref:Uncharacterized protein n=1 Tax=Fonsecaea erecta TaxID=1367422 RepID=A0A178Z459_9EURO|nr:hypothetical protein AYL99_11863 [Fonsecaea erecta]OAP53983.1 hypothetical protein AYL99_11863 [Fonsecaea erecta]